MIHKTASNLRRVSTRPKSAILLLMTSNILGLEMQPQGFGPLEMGLAVQAFNLGPPVLS